MLVKKANARENPPLTWRPWNGPSGNLVMVMFTCSEGHIGSLNHDIDRDGVVTPSVQCSEPGCTFHENIQLEGWEGK